MPVPRRSSRRPGKPRNWHLEPDPNGLLAIVDYRVKVSKEKGEVDKLTAGMVSELTYREIAREAVRWYENAATVFKMAGLPIAEDPSWVKAMRKFDAAQSQATG